MVKTTLNFKKEIIDKIIVNNWFNPATGGHTESNFLKYVSDNQPKYIYQIKYIAKAGMLFSSIMYICLIIIFITITVSYYFSFGIGFFILYLLRSLAGYHFSKNEQSDKNIVKHPEKYIYRH